MVFQAQASSHRPLPALSSSFFGLPYRVLNINQKKELPRGLWVEFLMRGGVAPGNLFEAPLQEVFRVYVGFTGFLWFRVF